MINDNTHLTIVIICVIMFSAMVVNSFITYFANKKLREDILSKDEKYKNRGGR